MDVLSTFDPSYLSTLFTFNEIIGTTPAGTAVEILKQNPLRVALWVGAQGISYLRPGTKNAAQNIGITIPSGGMDYPMMFRDWPGLVGQRWTLFNSAATPFYGWEIVYLPPSQ